MVHKITELIENKIFLIFFLAFILLIFFIVVVGVIFGMISFDVAGQIGSAFGGILGPFTGLFSGLLLFKSLSEQRKTNQLIIDNQRLQILVDSINKYEENIYKEIEILTFEGVILTRYTGGKHQVSATQVPEETLNNIYFSISKFELLLMEGVSIKGFNEFPFQRLKNIYFSRKLKSHFNSIESILKKINRTKFSNKKRVDDILKIFQNINKNLLP